MACLLKRMATVVRTPQFLKVFSRTVKTCPNNTSKELLSSDSRSIQTAIPAFANSSVAYKDRVIRASAPMSHLLGNNIYINSLFANLYRCNQVHLIPVRTHKTHSGMKKRFRKMANGRIKYGRTGTQHLLRKHNRKRNRNLAAGADLPQGTGQYKRVRMMLRNY